MSASFTYYDQGTDLPTLKGSKNALFPFPTIAQLCQIPARFVSIKINGETIIITVAKLRLGLFSIKDENNHDGDVYQ